MKTIEDRVRETVSMSLGVAPDAVTPEKYFIDDLGADSLDVVEILMDTEQEFNIIIPERDADRLTTVGALIDYLKEYVQ